MVSRRSFLQHGAAGGLVVAVGLPMTSAAQPADGEPQRLGPFIRIDAQGSVTLVAPCVEMGQGSYTGLAMIVADELGADWSRMSVSHMPLDPAYRLFGMQFTAGSRMVRAWEAPLRKSAATARDLLVRAAAQRWGVLPAECRAESGHVVHGASGRRLPFGDVAADASRLAPATNVPLNTTRTLVGRPLQRLDTPAKVDGSAVYGIDVRVPGMLYAAIRQSPVYGAKLAAVDEQPIRGRKGVVAVVRLPDAVAVVADNFWRAKEAVQALGVTFTKTPQASLSSADIAKAQRIQLDSPVARTAINAGDAQGAIAASRRKVSADFTVPYLHHATMEPMTCTVDLSGDRCQVWVPTQNLSGAAETAARLSGLPLDKVAVHLTYIGGGFGRKFEQDFVEQAVLIAKAVKRPVQLVWSREEDVQHGRYRPMMTSRLTADLAPGGEIHAMALRLVGPSIPEFRHGGVPFTAEFDPRMVLGVATETKQAPGALQQYAVAHFLTEVVYAPAHVPVSSWRSVAASGNGFFIESFIDELAVRAKADPYQYRRALLRESPRGLATLDRAATAAGWGRPLPKGRFRGIAFSECVGSMVAQVAEVSVRRGAVKVHRIVCAIDCGRAVNPDLVRAQVEGSIVMALSAALQEQITIEQGRCMQSNFHDYPVMRLADTPAIDVHLIDSAAERGGVGEAAVPSTAPAVCNAIFAATGRRLRSLPIAAQWKNA